MYKVTKEMLEWMNDGNVEKYGEYHWIEQTTQWRKKFTTTELIKFYHREFRDLEVLGETCRNGKEWDRCNCC